MEPNGNRVRGVTYEIVKASLQSPEEIRLRRLGHMSDRAIGQNQVEANDGVDTKTISISLVGVPYPRLVSVLYQTPECLQERTSAEQQAAHADLLRNTGWEHSNKGVAALTHPSKTSTKNDDTVVLEFFVHGIPDQTGPYHGSASSRIISHLGELLSVDLNSLG